MPRPPLRWIAVALGCVGALVLGVLALGSESRPGAGPSPQLADQSPAEVKKLLERLPVRFEANQGQAAGKIDYLARGPGYTVSLGRDGAVLALRSKKAAGAAAGAGASAVVGMHLVGGNARPEVSGADRLAGTSNYLVGSDKRDWHKNVPSFERVRYEGVYPGVDMVWRGSQKELEYDFVVAPGSDPKEIAIGFKGSERLSVAKNGDLLIHADGGAIRQRQPVIYQGHGASRQRVSGSYALSDSHRRVGFKVGAYDRSKPLVIDPKIEYSTFLGGYNTVVANGGSQDTANGITFDSQGNAYVVGFTDSIPATVANPANKPYPTTSGALQTTFGGGSRDGFVTKLNPSGSGAVYSTYIGGSAEDRATDVEVDSAGNAYVSGFTISTQFPTTAGAKQTTFGGGTAVGSPPTQPRDGFVLKLNPAGNGLVYSSYLGGTGTDTINRIDIDSSGAVYAGGTTGPGSGTSANPSLTDNFPTTPGAFQTTFGGGAVPPNGSAAPNDAFVTKFNPAGTDHVYSTFLGGTQPDSGAGIAVDSDGSAYLAGATRSPTTFGTPGAFQTTLQSADPTDSDAYVAKLNQAGTALSYSTYVGGARFEGATGIDIDPQKNAYITGEVTSTDFPVTAGANQPSKASADGPNDSDSYVTKVAPDGKSLVYSTYNGSIGYDTGTDISVDSSGSAHVTGNTLGSFPLKNPVQVRTGDYDAYLTKFNADGSVNYSTHYGGGSRDFGQAVAADNSGNVYIAGRTDYYSDNSFPIKSAFQPQNGGFADAFAAKISSTPTSPLVNSMRSRGGPVGGGTSVVLTGTGFTGASSVKFGATPATSFKVDSPTQITAVSPPHAAGQIKVSVTTPAGTSPDNQVTVFEYAEGIWKLTGSTNLTHYDQQTRLLKDGRALLIGGTNVMFGSTLKSSEVYNPKTGTWSNTGDLNTARSGYTATALDGPACRAASPPAYCGDILVAAGSPNAAASPGGNTALNTAETYDAGSGTWTNTPGNLNVARSQHAASLLDGPECHAATTPAYCGKVLVVGGRTTGSTSLDSAELYDPANGQWTPTGSLPRTARQTTSALLPNGRVLLPGGDGNNRLGADIYNPATGNWDSAAPLNIGRERHTVVTLADGKVLVAAGTRPGDPAYLGTPQQAGDSSEIYDATTDTWTLVTDRLEGVARNNHDSAVLPNGKVLLAGGGRGGLTSEVFDPADNKWDSAGLLNISRGSGHPQAGSFETVVLSSSQTKFEADSAVCGNECGKVLVAGNTDTATTELYTPEPEVSSISPAGGAQGTSVQITGRGFTHGVKKVLFGTTAAVSFKVHSYGKITAVAPAGSGSVKITVVNEGGQASSAGSFALRPAGAGTPPPGGGSLSATFAGCPASAANVIRGASAGTKITGTPRGDRIFGGTGDDVVDALAGDDCVDLGTGNDRGQGGLGSDLMLAGRGNDRVSGSSGNDRIRGNPGNDRLNGGRGNDRVFGDSGNDILLGSFGNDVLHGVSGKDRISGSRGRDRINGGSGSDRISGGSSNDRISGDAGNDRINGNSGADRIKGNSGNDRITSRDNQRDRVNCGSGRDSVLADRKDIVARNCERVRRR